MSLLLLFRPTEGEGPEPPTEQPRRLLLGVGLVLASLIVGAFHG